MSGDTSAGSQDEEGADLLRGRYSAHHTPFHRGPPEVTLRRRCGPVASEEPPRSATPGPCPQGWAPSGLEEAGTGETGHTTQPQRLERHLRGPHSESQEPPRAGHSLPVREAAEAQRGGRASPVSHSKEAAETGPDPRAVCLSVCQSPPSCGQRPGPLSLLPSPEQRQQQPLLCVQSSQQMPELGGAGRPRALFSLPSTPCGGTQQAAWLCRIYLSTWELKKLAHSVPAPGSSAGGVCYSCLQGPGQD